MTIKKSALAVGIWCVTSCMIHQLNNPGNLMQESGVHFKGELSSSVRRDRFVSPVLGYRAMAKVILNYKRIDHLHPLNLDTIITRYAPPVENPTMNYINYVAKQTGFTTWSHLSIEKEQVLFPLVKAMAKFEQGKSFHDSDEVIRTGVRMALHDT